METPARLDAMAPAAADSPVAAILAREPVFDAHLDALQRAVDLDHDLGTRTPGHFDLVRARAGGLGTVVLVCWIDPDYLPNGARARAQALLEGAHSLAARHPDQLRLVGSAAELAAARAAGVIAGIPGIEGGHAIEGSLEVLEAFHSRGLRVMTLVWNNHLPWMRSCQAGAGPDIPAGLSDFGRTVVRRMNELGMVVDLSHAGERSFYDALDASSQPVMASHSGCHALHDHPRNLNDDQLRALADRDGVVGIVFHPGFLDADARAEEMRVRETDAYLTALGANPTETFVRQSAVMQRDAAPLRIERLVDHIEHAIAIAGPRCVGLGSDFDGIQRAPQGLSDASGYPRLAAAMLARGFDEGCVAAVMGGNMRRLFERVLR